MVITIPQYNGRVSPVFDVAGRLLVVEVGGGREVGRREVSLRPSHPVARAGELAGLGADVLVCGAISRELEVALVSVGVRVISHAVGPVEGVLAAFLEGRMDGRDLPFEECGGSARRGRPSGGRRTGAGGDPRGCGGRGGRRGRRLGAQGGGRRGGRS